MAGTQIATDRPPPVSDFKNLFPVVCVGLSAGGVRPLRELFQGLGTDTGMAFVVIHHLRRHPTLIPTILASDTRMPVEAASGGQLMRPNHVYVIPSGKELALGDGYLSVRPRTKLRGWTNVFSIFLDSLSKTRHLGIAVVLSGLDANGAAALRAFKQKGGITIAQAPKTARFPEMPQAAIATGSVDYVLAPEEIAGQLVRIADAKTAL